MISSLESTFIRDTSAFFNLGQKTFAYKLLDRHLTIYDKNFGFLHFSALIGMILFTLLIKI